MPVRYKNAKIWLGSNLGFQNSLTVSGSKVVSQNQGFDSEIDCAGRVIIPAFVDAHAHPVLAGRESFGPAITEADSIEQIQQAVGQWISLNPGAEWVQGGAYNRSLIDGGRFEATWLDAVSVSKPIVLNSDDHHSIWVNSEAMRLAGISPAKLLDTRAGVDLDSSGQPSGVFRETDAKRLILDFAPKPTLAQDLQALEWAQSQMVSLGIASVQDAWVDKELLELYFEANRLGMLRVSTNLAFWLQPESWRQDLEYFKTQISGNNLGAGALTAYSVKIFVDGVFGSATASVSEPYEASGLFGSNFWSPTELGQACKAASLVGLQLHLHTIGDKAVETALNAVEFAKRSKVLQATSARELATVLAHAELLSDPLITKMKALGVTANLQPLWGRPDSMMRSTHAQLGTRAEGLHRTRDLMDSGVRVTFGSDWPVSDPNPLLGLYTAVTRSLPGSEATHNSNQAVTLEQALHAYTAEAASQIGLDSRNGLLPGCQADFLILDGDPFDDIEALPNMNVLQTISGGKSLFTRH